MKHVVWIVICAILAAPAAMAQADSVNFGARASSTRLPFSGGSATTATPLGTVTPVSGWTYTNNGPYTLYVTINAGNNDCHSWSAQTPAGMIEGRDDCENTSSFGAFFLSSGQSFRFDGRRVPRLSVTAMAAITPGDWSTAGFRAPVNIVERHAYDGNRFGPCPPGATSGSIEYRRYRDLVTFTYGPQEYSQQYEVVHRNTCYFPPESA